MRFEPALPSTSSGTPSRSTAVGAIMLGIRRPAGNMWKPSGLRSCSPSMLLRWIPVPGTTIPAPSPFEHVTLHAPPARVDHRDVRRRAEPAGEEALGEARLVEPVEERGRALALRRVHRGDERLQRRRAGGSRSSSASASAISVPPADGGGFVSTSRPR